MKNYSVLLLAITLLVLTGCKPDLVVEEGEIDFSMQTVKVKVKNIGNKNAGPHLTYIEINEVGAADAIKPQSQFSANVSGIPAGNSWTSDPIPFSSFSSPRGLGLSTLTTANLVVRADAKNMVRESNEVNNIYSADFNYSFETVLFGSNRTGNHDIFTVRDNGTNLANLTNNPGEDLGPNYTPDGQKIVFTSDRTGDDEIFIMDENGSNPRNLTNNPGLRDWFPIVSPSGAHIAYWKEYVAGLSPQLYIMNIDGSGKTVLSDTSAVYPEPHVFSPSGSLLAYAATTAYGPKIYVVKSDGTGRHVLTTDQAREIRPRFMCDDLHVIFDTMRDGNWEIYKIGVDGAAPTNLTNNAASDFVHQLSPDCSKILFTSDRTGNSDIFIMNAVDGSGLLQLTNNPGPDESPFFSPDGLKVGFLSRPGNSGKFDLWVINSDGTNLHKVSSPASSGATCCPIHAFSTNGGKVLFHSVPLYNNFEIFTVNTDGTNLINISNDPAIDSMESFKP